MKYAYWLIILVLVASNIYFAYLYNGNYRYGEITVQMESPSKYIISGDGIKIEAESKHSYSLEYGTYGIEIPAYKLNIIIWKNHRGIANVFVDKNGKYRIDTNGWASEKK